MKLIRSIIVIASAASALSTSGLAVAATSDAVIRPQTLQTPVIRNSSQPTALTSLNINQVVANSDKNSKNCTKGNNDQTGNGQNNGNCAASK